MINLLRISIYKTNKKLKVKIKYNHTNKYNVLMGFGLYKNKLKLWPV